MEIIRFKVLIYSLFVILNQPEDVNFDIFQRCCKKMFRNKQVLLKIRKQLKKTAKDKKILFVSKGESSASTRYRALNYFDAFQLEGWRPDHVSMKHSFSKIKLLKAARQADVVIILRKTFSRCFMRFLTICSKHLIFDFDDAIFCNSNGAFSATRNRRFIQTVRGCNRVFAGNDYLSEIAGKYNSDVITIPTSIDPEKYAATVEKPGDHIDLVWIGSSSTRKYIENILPVLELAADVIPGLRLKIVADFDLSSNHLKTTAVKWSKKNESYDLGSAHIGIAPMSNDPWTKGKCGLKVLQYMAAGLPVISSYSGVNREIVKHGVTGFFAETDKQWQRAIKNLANDPILRKKMGTAGKEIILHKYSTNVAFSAMQKAVNQLIIKNEL